MLVLVLELVLEPELDEELDEIDFVRSSVSVPDDPGLCWMRFADGEDESGLVVPNAQMMACVVSEFAYKMCGDRWGQWSVGMITIDTETQKLRHQKRNPETQKNSPGSYTQTSHRLPDSSRSHPASRLSGGPTRPPARLPPTLGVGTVSLIRRSWTT